MALVRRTAVHMVTKSSIGATLYRDLDQISEKAWTLCAGTDHPFTQYGFFKALEDSGCVGGETGWDPHYLVMGYEGSHSVADQRSLDLAQPNTIAAILPLFVKHHSYGEYVFDHSWASAFERAGGQYYPKLLGAVPFTPVTGPRFLVRHDMGPLQGSESGDWRRGLALTATDIAEKAGLSSLHLNFLREDDAQALADTGFMIRHDQQFHWQNDGYETFDDFLAALASRKRKQIRKERRTIADSDISITTLTGTEISESHWDIFYRFYLDTGARKWGTPYLNRAFFSEVTRYLGDAVVLFLCERGDRPIAGALNFVGRDTLYGRYWGCIEDHPCLHFETCYYRAIDYAIENGLKTVEAGAQGSHKLARGYVPTRTYSAHWISNPGFRDAVEAYLTQERSQIDREIAYLGDRAPFKKAISDAE